MTDKLKITLEDLGALDKPTTEADIAQVAFLVNDVLHYTGGNPCEALALLIASISALASRCEEHVGVLAAAWMELDEELRGYGPELAEAMARMHPRLVAAITGGEIVESRAGWQDDVHAAADQIDRKRSAVPEPIDHFDRGDTQDLPEEP